MCLYVCMYVCIMYVQLLVHLCVLNFYNDLVVYRRHYTELLLVSVSRYVLY